jgi:hypothetical protein
MRKQILTGMQWLKQSLITMFLVGMVGFLSNAAIAQPVYVSTLSPEQELQEIEQDLAKEDRNALYAEETAIMKDPKMGAEKQYEENLKEYKKENPDDNVVVEKVKDLLTPKSQKP